MNDPHRPATAADVARRAGVDRSTVSRILNRSFREHRYNEQTIRAVEDAARHLNYRPSTTARALRIGKSMLVGILVGDIANSFFGQIAACVESQLRPHHYRLLIASTGEDAELQEQHIRDMLHRGVDGLIVSPCAMGGLGAAADAQVPAVLIDRPLKGSPWHYIGIDNHDAGRRIGEHLRERGYRKIGVVLPDTQADPTLRWRLQGLKTGLGGDARLMWKHATPLRAGREARDALSQRLTQARRGVEAIVGLTNDCTLLALEASRDAKLRCPDELGLCGIDDFRAAELLDPPLTVAAQPVEAIARTAVEHLLAAMQGRVQPAPALLPPRLICRGSLAVLKD